MTRGWLYAGGRSTSVAAAATSTLIEFTSYHLRERNVMNSRFVGPTGKIPEECRMIFHGGSSTPPAHRFRFICCTFSIGGYLLDPRLNWPMIRVLTAFRDPRLATQLTRDNAL